MLVKSNQIKSLLLSHHLSTSALVSEILKSVLQTVQKKQFTYGQYIFTYLQYIFVSRNLHYAAAPNGRCQSLPKVQHAARQCDKSPCHRFMLQVCHRYVTGYVTRYIMQRHLGAGVSHYRRCDTQRDNVTQDAVH